MEANRGNSTSMALFTFQSGYIQMRSPLKNTIDPVLFTFQSGYIQIQSPHMYL